jgi:hypothetical protein
LTYWREEIQHMRSSNDPITGLKNHLLEWNVIPEADLKKIDHHLEEKGSLARRRPVLGVLDRLHNGKDVHTVDLVQFQH